MNRDPSTNAVRGDRSHGDRAGRGHGFTLIELVIVVAIIGIVAAIAVPSYARYVERTRRVDATAFLAEVAGEQERYFSENNAYARTSMKELGYGAADTHPTPEGHYVVSIAPLGARGYTLTATAVPGGRQANDTDCAVLSLTSTGVKTPSAAAGGANCW